MTDETFETRLREICSKIDTLPEAQRVRLMEVVDVTRKRHEGIGDCIRRASNALDDWRLLMKYRLFDIEASLREAKARRRKQADGNDE